MLGSDKKLKLHLHWDMPPSAHQSVSRPLGSLEIKPGRLPGLVCHRSSNAKAADTSFLPSVWFVWFVWLLFLSHRPSLARPQKKKALSSICYCRGNYARSTRFCYTHCTRSIRTTIMTVTVLHIVALKDIITLADDKNLIMNWNARVSSSNYTDLSNKVLAY